jgi:hypothetical protein
VPSRTDIYDKIGKFLKLPRAKVAKLTDHQRKEPKFNGKTTNFKLLLPGIVKLQRPTHIFARKSIVDEDSAGGPK